MIYECASTVKKPLSQAGKVMNFAAKGVRTSIMSKRHQRLAALYTNVGRKVEIFNQNIIYLDIQFDKAVAYICNPDKTDESIYISSYACAPETAAIDFKYTLDHCRENSPNKAYLKF